MKQYVTADKYVDEEGEFEVMAWENVNNFKDYMKNPRPNRIVRVYEFETATGQISEVNPKDLAEYKVNIKQTGDFQKIPAAEFEAGMAGPDYRDYEECNSINEPCK